MSSRRPKSSDLAALRQRGRGGAADRRNEALRQRLEQRAEQRGDVRAQLIVPREKDSKP